MAATLNLDSMALVEHSSNINCWKWKQQTSTLALLWFIHTGHRTKTIIKSRSLVRSSHLTQETVWPNKNVKTLKQLAARRKWCALFLMNRSWLLASGEQDANWMKQVSNKHLLPSRNLPFLHSLRAVMAGWPIRGRWQTDPRLSHMQW